MTESVLSLLPPYEGKNVLELGSGIGRFTGELAKKAGKVTAIDFIESVVKKICIIHHGSYIYSVVYIVIFFILDLLFLQNESINGHHENVEFKCADVISPDLNFPAESMDLIFSNWLLMYLSDKEVEYIAERLLKWVKVFKECHTSDASGNTYELSLIGSKCIGAYVRNKKNQNQICWIWQKAVNTENDRDFQQFLDNVQYKNTGIFRYERIFGPGFVSTGGIGISNLFMLRDAGFGEVIAEDRTEQFKEVLRRELERAEKENEEFIHDFTLEDYNDIVGGWKAKLVRTGSGEQRWGLFFAKKKGNSDIYLKTKKLREFVISSIPVITSSNARNTEDVEFEDAEVDTGLEDAEHYRNPTSGNNITLDDQTTERLYIPEVASSCVPVIGMEFSSIEQAYVFYQTYAKKAGFSTRKGDRLFEPAVKHKLSFVRRMGCCLRLISLFNRIIFHSCAPKTCTYYQLIDICLRHKKR
ncbi:putative phosphoethanolamine N-methyltransferase [Helianthus annuus]|nr:putative phosphoethanolamine N-methyltransferase [Helianthus annuus]